MSTLLPLRPGQSVPDYWESVAHRARVAREAGPHPDDVVRRFRAVEDEAATLSALLGADEVLAEAGEIA